MPDQLVTQQRDLPEPYPCGKSNWDCPYTRRCAEIDAAAELITDPDAFAAEVAEDPQLSTEAPAVFFEKPNKAFTSDGGCPAYAGMLNSGCPATVVCRLVDLQLHSYLEVKFCEKGRNVYCPIWRAKGERLKEDSRR